MKRPHPMKRGEFQLRRRAPMRRSEHSLLRRAGMVQGSRKPPPVVTLRTPQKYLGRDRIDSKLRALVYRRSGGACDLCGEPLREAGFEAHHRKLRSQGGKDDAATLIAVHAACHAQVHANPAESQRCGAIVPSWADPESTPLLRHGRRWQQPTAGGWVKADPIGTGDGDGAAQIDGSAPGAGIRVSGHAETTDGPLSPSESEAS